MYFASDTGAAVAPAVMAALIRENSGAHPSYGSDPATARTVTRIREIFEAPAAEVFFVTSGTAANALALATICPPWAGIFCHQAAHIHEDECGAPEFFSHGAKLVPVPGEGGKITPDALRDVLARTGTDPVHGIQRGALSLSNVTEAGTIYSATETAALTEIARAHGLPVHLDGARLVNALAAGALTAGGASNGASPADLTWRAGIDILSLGATKGGCMGAEAVVLFNPSPAQAHEFQLRRKRGGHLLSKHRFLAAQIEGWLEGGLWLALADHANRVAARLADGISRIPGMALRHPVQANILFTDWPLGTNDRLRAAGASFHDSNIAPDHEGARLVTSWATGPRDVERLLAVLAAG